MHGAGWLDRATQAVRLMLGFAYLVNGLNWFVKIITPYPSISDFVDYMPPPDIVGALIENGIMFHLAKGIEVVTGIALLANRFVPLSLVVAMTVTVPVFITDVFKPEWKLRAFLMGSGSLVMNVYLLFAYFDHFRPMMALKAAPNLHPDRPQPAEGGAAADLLGALARPAMLALAPIALAMGLAMTVWLSTMIVQHAADPKAIHEVRKMVPRAR
ncbi:DoxX family membrane protein [Sphingomonas canadensis]|uniref:DoxX family membrane protein n=1 Tax=Sphingomonas canadensis TaxID=1219257 RepID=A0ABW3HEC8_9SPHN|nr:DoxX family membrane protein [Sphingomonas canadensis]MCW3838288.1 hypothetical protein [Sphingomonas canadensis]